MSRNPIVEKTSKQMAEQLKAATRFPELQQYFSDLKHKRDSQRTNGVSGTEHESKRRFFPRSAESLKASRDSEYMENFILGLKKLLKLDLSENQKQDLVPIIAKAISTVYEDRAHKDGFFNRIKRILTAAGIDYDQLPQKDRDTAKLEAITEIDALVNQAVQNGQKKIYLDAFNYFDGETPQQLSPSKKSALRILIEACHQKGVQICVSGSENDTHFDLASDSPNKEHIQNLKLAVGLNDNNSYDRVFVDYESTGDQAIVVEFDKSYAASRPNLDVPTTHLSKTIQTSYQQLTPDQIKSRAIKKITNLVKEAAQSDNRVIQFYVEDFISFQGEDLKDNILSGLRILTKACAENGVKIFVSEDKLIIHRKDLIKQIGAEGKGYDDVFLDSKSKLTGSITARFTPELCPKGLIVYSAYLNARENTIATAANDDSQTEKAALLKIVDFSQQEKYTTDEVGNEGREVEVEVEVEGEVEVEPYSNLQALGLAAKTEQTFTGPLHNNFNATELQEESSDHDEKVPLQETAEYVKNIDEFFATLPTSDQKPTSLRINIDQLLSPDVSKRKNLLEEKNGIQIVSDGISSDALGIHRQNYLFGFTKDNYDNNPEQAYQDGQKSEERIAAIKYFFQKCRKFARTENIKFPIYIEGLSSNNRLIQDLSKTAQYLNISNLTDLDAEERKAAFKSSLAVPDFSQRFLPANKAVEVQVETTVYSDTNSVLATGNQVSTETSHYATIAFGKMQQGITASPNVKISTGAASPKPTKKDPITQKIERTLESQHRLNRSFEVDLSDYFENGQFGSLNLSNNANEFLTILAKKALEVGMTIWLKVPQGRELETIALLSEKIGNRTTPFADARFASPDQLNVKCDKEFIENTMQPEAPPLLPEDDTPEASSEEQAPPLPQKTVSSATSSPRTTHEQASQQFATSANALVKSISPDLEGYTYESSADEEARLIEFRLAQLFLSNQDLLTHRRTNNPTAAMFYLKKHEEQTINPNELPLIRISNKNGNSSIKIAWSGKSSDLTKRSNFTEITSTQALEYIERYEQYIEQSRGGKPATHAMQNNFFQQPLEDSNQSTIRFLKLRLGKLSQELPDIVSVMSLARGKTLGQIFSYKGQDIRFEEDPLNQTIRLFKADHNGNTNIEITNSTQEIDNLAQLIKGISQNRTSTSAPGNLNAGSAATSAAVSPLGFGRRDRSQLSKEFVPSPLSRQAANISDASLGDAGFGSSHEIFGPEENAPTLPPKARSFPKPPSPVTASPSASPAQQEQNKASEYDVVPKR